MRIGHGFDAHRFGAARPLVIGGVTVPHPQGLLAHSDGDVLVHALCDALLGAAGLGDIGRHFPDSSAEYAGVDSRVLLRATRELLAEAGWAIVNVDSTINAQRPKMAPHIPLMVERLAADLQLPADRVSVKAKTAEKLGFVGRQEGISVDAVALIETLERPR